MYIIQNVSYGPVKKRNDVT